MINSVEQQKWKNLIPEIGLEIKNFDFMPIKSENLELSGMRIVYHGTPVYYFSYYEKHLTLKSQEFQCVWSPDKELEAGTAKTETLVKVYSLYETWLEHLKENLKVEGRIL